MHFYSEPRRGVQRTALAATAFFILLAMPALAGEKGKLRAHAALVTTKQETAKIEDKADHAVYFLVYDGVLFADGGGLLDRARYQAVMLSDTGGMVSGGYKTFTAADGAKVFARFTETDAAHPVYKGTWQFMGGTGKYQGVKGQGSYTYTATSETVGVDVLEGEYEIP